MDQEAFSKALHSRRAEMLCRLVRQKEEERAEFVTNTLSAASTTDLYAMLWLELRRLRAVAVDNLVNADGPEDLLKKQGIVEGLMWVDECLFEDPAMSVVRDRTLNTLVDSELEYNPFEVAPEKVEELGGLFK